MIKIELNFAILDQCLISVVNFLSSIILARVLPLDEFGLYIFAFTTLVFSVGLMNNIICSPLSLLGSSVGHHEWKRFLFNSTIVYFSISLTLMLIFTVSYLFLRQTKYILNGRILISVGVVVGFYLGQEFVRRAMFTRLESRNAFATDFVTYGTRMALILILIYYGKISSIIMVYLFGFTSFIGILVGLRFIGLSFLRNNHGIEKIILIKIWNLGKWIFADWLPFVISGQLYIYFVTFVLGNSANGILGACQNIVAPASILLVGVMNFALPYYANIYNRNGHDVLLNSLKTFFILLISGVIAYLFIINLFTEDILHLIYGKYEEYSNLVLLFSLGILINFLFKPVDVYLKVILKPKLVFISRTIAALVSICLCYPFIIHFGIQGAAWSYIISQASMCFALYYVTYSYKKVGKFRLFVEDHGK